MNGRASNKDRAFHCIRGFAIKTIGHGSEQAIFRLHNGAAGVSNHEAARAVGAFHHARRKTGLTNECRLLVTSNATNRDGRAQKVWCTAAKISAGILHHRQQRGGNIKQMQQLFIPALRADIKQHGARGVGGVGRMHFAMRELPQ